MKEIAGTFLLQIIPFAMVYHFLKRKWIADFEARVGPRETGFFGFAQEAADFVKLIQKKSVQVTIGDLFLMGIWFSVSFSLLGVVPLHADSYVVSSELGVLLFLLLVLLCHFVFLAWSIIRGELQVHLGGVRVIAQVLTASVLVICSFFFLLVQGGTLAWSDLAASQSQGIHAWNVWSYPPLGFLSFLFFVISGILLSFQSPFDLPFRSPELSGSMFGKSSGVFHLILRTGRFLLFFFWLVTTAHMYLGSWYLIPGLPRSSLTSSVVVLTKTLFLFLLVHWIQRVLPKLRVDQTTDFAWRILVPFAMVTSALFLMIKGVF